MTSPAPLSSFNPICSYCKKESKNPLFFIYKERGYVDKKVHKQIHWACCEDHKKQILKGEKGIITDSNILLSELIRMYVEIYEDNIEMKSRSLFKRIFKIKK